MEDIVQRVVFEKVGIDGINEAIEKLATSYTKAEEAQKGVFAGLGKQAVEANEAISETATKLDEASKSLSVWQKLSNAATKSAGFFKSAMAGVGDALNESINSLSLFGVSIGDARKKIGDARQSLLVYARANNIAGIAAKRAGASSVVGFNLARVGALALRTALGPIGLIISVVAIAFTLLAKAAKRSEPIMNAVSVASAAFGAAIDVLIDRLTAVAEVIFFANKALYQFISGDFDGAMESFGKATDAATAATASLNDELSKEIANAIMLEQLQQRIDRTMFNLEIRRAKANSDLKALNKITEDVTKTDEERADAAIKFRNIQEGLLSEEVEAREQQIAQILGVGVVTDELRAKILELGTAGIAFEELGDSANRFSTTLADIGDGKTTFDDEATGKLKDNIIALFDLQTQSDEILTTQANKLNTIRTQQEQRRKKAIEERKKAEEDLAAFQISIAQQLEQLAVDESTGEARIELERKIAAAQIDELEKVAREKFKAAKQTFDLESEFSELRAGVERDAARQVSEFRLAEAQRVIDERRDIELGQTELLTASADAELSLEEFKARERIRITRDALIAQREVATREFGEGSAPVLAIDVEVGQLEQADVDQINENVKRIQDETLKGINDTQAIRLAELEFIKKSTDEELNLEQFKQREKNRILIDGLLDRRNILTEQFGPDSAEVKLLDLEVGQLQQGIDDLDNLRLGPLEKIKARIQEAFNLDDETTALLVDQATNAFNSIVSGLESIYERQLAENDRLLEQIDNRIEKITESLDEELQKQEDGVANNASLLQARLDDENAKLEKAEAKRLEIEKKAARQRLIIESAQQASALGLAAAQLIASEASKGIVGIVLAAAGVATIFSIIAKAKAQAAQFSSDLPTFRGGGTAEGILVGASHEGGGINAFYNRKGRTYGLNLEGGEHVMPVSKTRQYGTLLEAMRTDDIGRLSNERVLSMMGRNPTNGISSKSYIQPTQKQYDSEGVDKIVQAIKDQFYPVMLQDGKVAFVEHTGTKRAIKRKIP